MGRKKKKEEVNVFNYGDKSKIREGKWWWSLGVSINRAMKPRILSWNVREANDQEKCKVIKSLARSLDGCHYVLTRN
ncbi:hypothetical protein CK203_017999 [Vitis vinifera]|uniref:Uncharacterized protein n=1 Tax=Vitis vinifera TaxID=29760 RepID=A0A438JWF2_VITVI|nr:hypothetical protein CK203_017999 [Vitis vinifera]